MHLLCFFAQAIDLSISPVQELPRASGPLEGFLCFLLATIYESKLNSVFGFSFCNA